MTVLRTFSRSIARNRHVASVDAVFHITRSARQSRTCWLVAALHAELRSDGRRQGSASFGCSSLFAVWVRWRVVLLLSHVLMLPSLLALLAGLFAASLVVSLEHPAASGVLEFAWWTEAPQPLFACLFVSFCSSCHLFVFLCCHESLRELRHLAGLFDQLVSFEIGV